MSELAPNRTLNAVGACRHGALMDLIDAMSDLRRGAVVEVLTDDRTAPDEIVAWARATGHVVLDRTSKGATCLLRIRAGPGRDVAHDAR